MFKFFNSIQNYSEMFTSMWFGNDFFHCVYHCHSFKAYKQFTTQIYFHVVNKHYESMKMLSFQS